MNLRKFFVVLTVVILAFSVSNTNANDSNKPDNSSKHVQVETPFDTLLRLFELQLSRLHEMRNDGTSESQYPARLYSVVFMVVNNTDGSVSEVRPVRIFDPVRVESFWGHKAPSESIKLPQTFLNAAKKQASKTAKPYHRAPLHPPNTHYIYLFFDPARPNQADLGVSEPFFVNAEDLQRIKSHKPANSLYQQSEKTAVWGGITHFAIQDGKRFLDSMVFADTSRMHNRIRNRQYYIFANAKQIDDGVSLILWYCQNPFDHKTNAVFASLIDRQYFEKCRKSLNDLRVSLKGTKNAIAVPSQLVQTVERQKRVLDQSGWKQALKAIEQLEAFDPVSNKVEKAFVQSCYKIERERRPAQLVDCKIDKFSPELAYTLNRLNNE